jgi:hypothetical protein
VILPQRQFWSSRAVVSYLHAPIVELHHSGMILVHMLLSLMDCPQKHVKFAQRDCVGFSVAGFPPELKTLADALSSVEGPYWQEAMEE